MRKTGSISVTTMRTGGPRIGARFWVVSSALILAACIWSYWRIVNELIDDWQGDPEGNKVDDVFPA